jgi:hypothetical protein
MNGPKEGTFWEEAQDSAHKECRLGLNCYQATTSEDVADWEDLEDILVIYSVCRFMKAL